MRVAHGDPLFFLVYNLIMFSLFPSLFAYQLVAPFILRIVLGVIFVLRGYRAFSNFSGDGAAVDSVGIKIDRQLLKIIGVIELLTGIFLIAGLYTQGAAILAALISLGKLWKGVSARSYESNLALLAISLSLILLGAGIWAMDKPF
ncbi:DoxX family protein [Candidatus Giovannonibacteria bacterium]|nr:DoxX family protein [Candidatus Giovannonibacteria bacterium]